MLKGFKVPNTAKQHFGRIWLQGRLQQLGSIWLGDILKRKEEKTMEKEACCSQQYSLPCGLVPGNFSFPYNTHGARDPSTQWVVVRMKWDDTSGMLGSLHVLHKCWLSSLLVRLVNKTRHEMWPIRSFKLWQLRGRYSYLWCSGTLLGTWHRPFPFILTSNICRALTSPYYRRRNSDSEKLKQFVQGHTVCQWWSQI